MKLTSPDFEDDGALPAETGYRTDNKRPTLEIAELPEYTDSLAVIVHDPDAPSGDFCHWVAWNFPPHVTNIPGDSLPQPAVEGTNDFGQIGWGGPAPPSGTHHYHFAVYALNSPLGLPPETTKKILGAAMQGKILDQAEIVGLFSAS